MKTTISKIRNSLYELYIKLEKVKESVGNLEDKLIEIICYDKQRKTDCSKVIMSLVTSRKIPNV